LQAEAEEAERRARIQMEVKKSLTHILLNVTDGLFGVSAALHTFIMHIYSINSPAAQICLCQCNCIRV